MDNEIFSKINEMSVNDINKLLNIVKHRMCNLHRGCFECSWQYNGLCNAISMYNEHLDKIKTLNDILDNS